MKLLIPIVIGLLVVGCGSGRKLTAEEEKILGTYELKDKDGEAHKIVFLENGIMEGYDNGKKQKEEFKWKIYDGEINVYMYDDIYVFKINEDSSITLIAVIDADGKRSEDAPKEEQWNYKKVK